MIRVPEAERATFRRLFTDPAVTTTAIAARYGVSVDTVRKWAGAMALPKRRRDLRPPSLVEVPRVRVGPVPRVRVGPVPTAWRCGCGQRSPTPVCAGCAEGQP